MKTSWGGVSGWYDELLEKREGTYQKEVILPNLMRLAEPIQGANVLDLACGQGFFAREWAKAGAAKVFGADIAKELIEIAKKNAQTVGGETAKKIEYHVAPANEIKFCADGTIDMITIVLALQNIEDLPGTMRECARVLKPAGRLYIVLNHPAFRIPKQSSWQWESIGDIGGKNGPTETKLPKATPGRQYRRIDAYMSESRERIDMTPGEDDRTFKKFTVSFHRPLQVYFKALNKAGFAVSRLEEWISHKQSAAGYRADEENRIRKEIPMFLTLEARKVK